MSRWITFFVTAFVIFAVQHADGEDTPTAAPSAAAETVPAVDFDAILRRPVKVEFADTPLSDVADFFAAKFDINVQLDAKGLADAAVDSAAPVTISLRKPVSFEAALQLVLENFNLTFVVQDEVLKITSKEKADEILTTKVYAVEDLLDRGPRRNYNDGLIETITSTIQPDSWDDNGGPGSISRVASTLVIAQKWDVHKELRDLFAMLRAELPKRAPTENAQAPKSDEAATVVYKLHHAVGQETAAAIMTITDPASWQTKDTGISVVKMKSVVHTAQGDEDRSWDALVVRQTESVQNKVQEFLGELGRLHWSGSVISGPRGGLGP
jgi:type II secretory pathway component GspD/PulD (secretin)